MPFQKNRSDIRELIVRVRNNDEEAFKILLEQYKPLIESSVNRFSCDDAFGTYSDDLRQEASVVFYKSILAYDLDQTEIEFGLFTKICIHNALASQLRTLKKHSEIPDGVLLYQDLGDPASKIIEQERIKSIYAVIRKNLSDFEYAVWQMYVAGRSSSDIAKILNTEKRSIDNAIYRTRKKLRALLK